MIPAIREDVRRISEAGYGIPQGQFDNKSLMFNRLCKKIDEPRLKETKAKKDALLGLESGYTEGCRQLYRLALNNWRAFLSGQQDVILFEMRNISPLIVGKGDQNVHEFGMTFQPPWATPVIPGSAVKGVVSTFAHEAADQNWSKSFSPESYSGAYSLVMFGGANEQGNQFAGAVDFLDAWWIPDTRTPFAEDIISAHNRSWYQADDKHALDNWPDGMDNPVPFPFATIKPGQRFLFAVRGPGIWAELAKKIIVEAGVQNGFGAKTRAGYGLFEYLPADEEVAADISDMSDDQLLDVYKEKGNSAAPILQDAFRKKANQINYSKALEPLLKKYCPGMVMRNKLEQGSLKNLKQVKNIYDQHKSAFDLEPIKTSNSDIQKIFNICMRFENELKKMPPEAWVWQFAPSAKDFLEGKDADQLNDFIENYDQAHPAVKDFRPAIEELELEEEEKELLLMAIDEKIEKMT
ncbi:type III-B CRISPR module RAMP protein Cmr6 [Desulfobacter hydrogenophilus]|uniref:Type III-B CRISPR module RAMP protein Cmr6 n=1 Tax=Desulfobacter hydrogenophilus TaxID=2291 RepID=A0A328FF21_9BACT|nr:type III-B CRISPR module RAMP protein Cmr6 [Desulfobacter hydrogenophilus]NDY71655.1 type III-B CRISPR module RAMP protein Cmr6 [Desulfobacter hydrogenophilus]QBH13169.1 type III-B CRISPR module RAMP protein Cmr6 [Desulfobacter hydrogenophilus]RAM02410.1 type III-B CRISPR module RAMP protein Cmr6 [Desulfobacter hydrogenophilus]